MFAFKDFLEVFRVLLDYLQILTGLLNLPAFVF